MPAAAQSYPITDLLGLAAGSSSVAHGINSLGWVGGAAETAGITGTAAPLVLPPSCRDPGTASCCDNYDADHAGADMVYPASSGKDLLVLYHRVTTSYGDQPPDPNTPGWCALGPKPNMPARGVTPHELWIRPFTVTRFQ